MPRVGAAIVSEGTHGRAVPHINININITNPSRVVYFLSVPHA